MATPVPSMNPSMVFRSARAGTMEKQIKNRTVVVIVIILFISSSIQVLIQSTICFSITYRHREIKKVQKK